MKYEIPILSDFNGSGSIKWGQITKVITSINDADGDETFQFIIDLMDGLTPIEYKRKEECNGYVPAYIKGENRKGENEVKGTVQMLYIDVDNKVDEQNEIYLSYDDALGILNETGFSYCIYETWSSNEGDYKDRFRILIEINEMTTREDIKRVAHLFTEKYFKFKPDMSVYDEGKMLFAPPFEKRKSSKKGNQLNVGEWIRSYINEYNSNLDFKEIADTLSRKINKLTGRIQKVFSPDENKGINDKIKNTTIEPFESEKIILENLKLDDYKNGVKSRWEVMRSLLGTAWVMTNGEMTFGNLKHLAKNICLVHPFVKNDIEKWLTGFKRGEKVLDDLIGYIIKQGIPKYGYEHWHLPCDMDIETYNHDCGEGKTYQMLNDIAKSLLNDDCAQFVFVCDKIKNITERESELFGFIETVKKNRPFGPWGLKEFTVRKIYSDQDIIKNEDDKNEMDENQSNGVIKSITEFVGDVKTSKSFCLFISHKAFFMLPKLDCYPKITLIIDEIPDVIQVFNKNFKVNHKKVKEYLNATPEKNQQDILKITLSDKGIKDFEKGTDDLTKAVQVFIDSDKIIGSGIWTEKKSWDNMETSSLSFVLEHTPYMLKSFKKVIILGDEFEESMLYHCWKNSYNVKFKAMDLANKRDRTVLLKERGCIYYFAMYKQASRKYFESLTKPLELIAEWLKVNLIDNNVGFILTANAIQVALSKKLQTLTENGLVKYISPKAHGLNTLQDYTKTVWLASMKLNHFERNLIKHLYQMDEETQVRWREHNPLWQFILRSNVRDFDSNILTHHIVFDEKQAKYIQKRTGWEIVHIEGVLQDDVEPNNGGRPTINENALTKKERNKKYHDKKKAVKVEGVLQDVKPNKGGRPTINENALTKKETNKKYYDKKKALKVEGVLQENASTKKVEENNNTDRLKNILDKINKG